MKKLLCTLLLAFVCTGSMFAQKGMNGVGLNVPVGVYDGFVYLGIGAKYQYNISDYFRIEPSVEYIPVCSKKTVSNVKDYDHPSIKAFLNGHIFLLASRPARPYILLGAGFGIWEYANISESYAYNTTTGKVSGPYYSESEWTSESFTYNLGLGYDFRFSYKFALQVEATAFSSIVDNGHNAYKDYDHSGKFSFLGRVGLVYTF